MSNKLNFKFLLIIFLLCLSSLAFCENKEKTKEDKSPSVVCMVVFAKEMPTMINISYREKVSKTTLENKLKKLESAFKGKFEILQADESLKGITAIINDTKMEPGTGATLEPFIKTFSEEKNYIVIFTGEFKANKDPLVMYQKDDFTITGNISDTTLQYNINSKGNNKNISLPKGQKSLTYGRIAKAMFKIVLYIIIGIILIFVVIILMQRAILRHKTRS